MNEEALIRIESELHNLNLNIMELTKAIKDMSSSNYGALDELRTEIHKIKNKI